MHFIYIVNTLHNTLESEKSNSLILSFLVEVIYCNQLCNRTMWGWGKVELGKGWCRQRGQVRFLCLPQRLNYFVVWSHFKNIKLSD